jgi:hypothetical protein
MCRAYSPLLYGLGDIPALTGRAVISRTVGPRKERIFQSPAPVADGICVRIKDKDYDKDKDFELDSDKPIVVVIVVFVV